VSENSTAGISDNVAHTLYLALDNMYFEDLNGDSTSFQMICKALL